MTKTGGSEFDISKLDSDMEEKIEEIIRLKCQLIEKDNEINYLKSTIKSMQASTSWRIGQLCGRYLSRFSYATPFILYISRKILHSNGGEYTTFKDELKTILADHKGKTKGIIVYPPTVDWNIPLFQRPQQLALELSKIGYLFFYSTFNLFDNVSNFYKINDNCYLTNKFDLLLKELPEIVFLVSSTRLRLDIDFLNKVDNKRLILYDYIDEIHPDISGQGAELQKQMLRRHEYMVKQSDIAIATADRLLEDLLKYRSEDIYLIPNGVDYDHFHISRDPNKVPEDIELILRKGSPVIGYYGALAKWFDYELIIDIAKKRPDYQIILIGSDYDGSLERYDLDKIRNIYHIGAKKYEVLPEYAIWFDVSIIPFILNKVTESTSPIKIFEYMALGTPIVTTNMHECQKYKSILIGKDSTDFVKKIDEAIKLRHDREYLELLDKDARNNTWDIRARQIDEAIFEKKLNLLK